MDTPTRFIIIDDDKLNNKICTVTLEKICHNTEIRSFTDASKGLEYIMSEYPQTNYSVPTVLLLDLLMPVMDGWEFLDAFRRLDPAIKNQIRIYILSSSEDRRDMERADADVNVASYLVKPLNRYVVEMITGGLKQGGELAH